MKAPVISVASKRLGSAARLHVLALSADSYSSAQERSKQSQVRERRESPGVIASLSS